MSVDSPQTGSRVATVRPADDDAPISVDDYMATPVNRCNERDGVADDQGECELVCEPDADPGARQDPFRAVSQTPTHVCRCGAGPHPELDGRCAAGHTWRGTPGPALIVGDRSATFWSAHEEARR